MNFKNLLFFALLIITNFSFSEIQKIIDDNTVTYCDTEYMPEFTLKVTQNKNTKECIAYKIDNLTNIKERIYDAFTNDAICIFAALESLYNQQNNIQ